MTERLDEPGPELLRTRRWWVPVLAGGAVHAGVAFMLAPGLVVIYAYGVVGLSSYDQLAWLNGGPALTALAAWMPVLFSFLIAGVLAGHPWSVPVLRVVVDRAWLVYLLGILVSIAGSLASLSRYVLSEWAQY